MEPPFWTQGPVPLQLLQSLSIDRKDAVEGVTSRLRSDRFASASGAGCSTFANQVAAAWQGPTWVVDGDALLRDDESEHLHVLTDASRIPKRRTSMDPSLPSWNAVAGQDALLILDRDRSPEWLEDLRTSWPGAILLAVRGSPTDVTLRSLPDDAAAPFLDQRAARVGVTWSRSARDELLELAEGAPDALQRLGREALMATLLSSRSRIDEDAALNGAVAATTDPPDPALSRVQGARLRLLKAMARFPNATPTEWSRACQVPQKSAVVHLQRLATEDRLVERTGRGKYRIRSPLVRLHLQNRYGTIVRKHDSRRP